MKEEKEKPSWIIDEIVEDTDYDYRDSCGAINCVCYENSVKIDAIIKYLDKLEEGGE